MPRGSSASCSLDAVVGAKIGQLRDGPGRHPLDEPVLRQPPHSAGRRAAGAARALSAAGGSRRIGSGLECRRSVAAFRVPSGSFPPRVATIIQRSPAPMRPPSAVPDRSTTPMISPIRVPLAGRSTTKRATWRSPKCQTSSTVPTNTVSMASKPARAGWESPGRQGAGPLGAGLSRTPRATAAKRGMKITTAASDSENVGRRESCTPAVGSRDDRPYSLGFAGSRRPGSGRCRRRMPRRIAHRGVSRTTARRARPSCREPRRAARGASASETRW